MVKPTPRVPHMRMVGHESPGIEGSAGLDDEPSEAFEEALTAAIAAEDPAPLDAAADEVVQRTGITTARPAAHTPILMTIGKILVKYLTEESRSFLRPRSYR